MKFIFPQNYQYHHKILGLIDYSTAILNVCWLGFLISISNLFFKNLDIKIFICISFYFPLLLFSFIGLGGENIIYVFLYIKNFFKNRRIYFYIKK